MSPLIGLFILALCGALYPCVLLLLWTYSKVSADPLYLQALGMALALGACFWIFAFSLILVVPLINLPFIPLVRSYRGPWFSVEAIPWYFHNALLYLVRYTVLDLLTPSPVNTFFYKAMGMKIGKGTFINTSNVSDACLIELGDYVTIGGSVTMFAHYGMKGFLIIDKLTIGSKTTVGLNANILGGVKIGENVTIAPNVTVLPKTIIADNTKYGLKE